MKHFCSRTAFLIGALIVPSVGFGQSRDTITARYDRFRDSTVIQFMTMARESAATVRDERASYSAGILALFAGETPMATPLRAILLISFATTNTKADGWPRLNGNGSGILLVDDSTRIALKQSDRSQRVSSFLSYELVEFPISLDDLRRLATARKIEASVNGHEMLFGADWANLAAELVRRSSPPVR